MALKSKRWKQYLRELRRRFPISMPVRVIRRRVGKNAPDVAWTVFDGHTYRIVIDAKCNWREQVDALWHEWAHAFCIDESYKHGRRWGSVHGEIYEHFVDKPEERKDANTMQ